MKGISKILAGGVGAIALAGAAAPAAAQSYGYGYGGGGGDILGAIINSVLGQNRGYGGGYGYRSGYDPNRERYLVDQCARASQARIQRSFGQASYNPYGGYGGGYSGGGYGYGNAQSAARIVGISRVDRRSNGGVKIWGTATSGRGGSGYGGGYGGNYGGGYGGGYGYNAAADLRFDCTINYRGQITDIDVGRNNYGYRRY